MQRRHRLPGRISATKAKSDLTSVAAYDLKAGCKQYGWNQTLDASPTGNIYTGTNHHYDNVVEQVDSRAMYAHKLRVADGMTVSIVAAQNDTEDEGGLTYIKGNNSGNNLYFYWSMGEYDADGNVVFDRGLARCQRILDGRTGVKPFVLRCKRLSVRYLPVRP